MDNPECHIWLKNFILIFYVRNQGLWSPLLMPKKFLLFVVNMRLEYALALLFHFSVLY